MTTPMLHRDFAPDLELRGGDGRTIVGLAVPFDVPTRVVDRGPDGLGVAYVESFKLGSFRKTIAERGERVKLMTLHDRQRLPLGRAMVLREDAAGLYTELRVSRTVAGDEVLELVRDGALTDLSIGFRPIRPGPAHRIAAGAHVVRTEVGLDEISVVSLAAYEDARILDLRELQADTEVEGTPLLDQWRRRYPA